MYLFAIYVIAVIIEKEAMNQNKFKTGYGRNKREKVNGKMTEIYFKTKRKSFIFKSRMDFI